MRLVDLRDALGLRRVHQVGDGVRVVIVDDGVADGPWFTGGRVSGERGVPGSHATWLAQVVLAVAPGASVVSRLLTSQAAWQEEPRDLVLCAWGAQAPRPLPPGAIVTAAHPHEFPATAPGAHSVRAGQWSIDAVSRRQPVSAPFRGASLHAALAAGLAALLLGAGNEPDAAARLAASGPRFTLSLLQGMN